MPHIIGTERARLIIEPAGQDYSDIRPPEGYEWIIKHLNFYHTSPDDEAGVLYFYDETLPDRREAALKQSTLSTWEELHLYAANFPHLVRLTHDFYIHFTCDVDNDKNIYTRVVYTERPENYDLLWQEWIAHANGFSLPIQSRDK